MRTLRVTRIGLIVLLAALGLGACARLLGYRSAERAPFAHRAHVTKGIGCLTCHTGVDKAGDEGPLHLPDTATCVKCHQKPHDNRTCSNCHGTPGTVVDLTDARRHLRFAHAKHLPTVKWNCMRCHLGAASPGEHLRPAMAACTACHMHDAQFAGRDCDSCHVDLPGEKVRPMSHLVHGPDFMREHGARAASAVDMCATCHAERFCSSCHGQTVPTLPSRMSLGDPMRADMHRAGFRARHAEAARTDPGTCMTCHRPESFCAGCHQQKGVAAGPIGGVRRPPHPPGWVGPAMGDNQHGREARRDPASCASCHGGAGEAMCVSCHKVGGVGGSVHPPGWTSTRDLGEVPCRSCHRVGP